MIEVLIAILLLSMALIALAGLMTSTIRSTNMGKNTTIAANLAQERMERLKMTSSVNFDNVVDAVAGSDPLTGANPDSSEDYGAIAGYAAFRREVYITDQGTAPINAKDVAVRVLWRDVFGTHSALLRTTLAR
ncbi:MAG: hypothetical protein HZB83_06305 [Deltaproteobacteria bacterium]|nr:hypothetical protein [Deltaproteobacteria bacterium]